MGSGSRLQSCGPRKTSQTRTVKTLLDWGTAPPAVRPSVCLSGVLQVPMANPNKGACQGRRAGEQGRRRAPELRREGGSALPPLQPQEGDSAGRRLGLAPPSPQPQALKLPWPGLTLAPVTVSVMCQLVCAGARPVTLHPGRGGGGCWRMSWKEVVKAAPPPCRGPLRGREGPGEPGLRFPGRGGRASGGSSPPPAPRWPALWISDLPAPSRGASSLQ